MEIYSNLTYVGSNTSRKLPSTTSPFDIIIISWIQNKWRNENLLFILPNLYVVYIWNILDINQTARSNSILNKYTATHICPKWMGIINIFIFKKMRSILKEKNMQKERQQKKRNMKRLMLYSSHYLSFLHTFHIIYF